MQPIAVIRGNCELLLADLYGPLTDKQRQSIERIGHQAEALELLVERLTKRS